MIELVIAALTLLSMLCGAAIWYAWVRAARAPERQLQENDRELERLATNGTPDDRSVRLAELLDKAERSHGDRRQ